MKNRRGRKAQSADHRAPKRAAPPETSGIANGPPVGKWSEEAQRSRLDLGNRIEIRKAKGVGLAQLGLVFRRIHTIVPNVERPIVRRAVVIIDHGEAPADGTKHFELIKDSFAPRKPLRSLEDLDEGKLDFLPPSTGSIITDRVKMCHREDDKSTKDKNQE